MAGKLSFNDQLILVLGIFVRVTAEGGVPKKISKSTNVCYIVEWNNDVERKARGTLFADALTEVAFTQWTHEMRSFKPHWKWTQQQPVPEEYPGSLTYHSPQSIELYDVICWIHIIIKQFKNCYRKT